MWFFYCRSPSVLVDQLEMGRVAILTDLISRLSIFDVGVKLLDVLVYGVEYTVVERVDSEFKS